MVDRRRSPRLGFSRPQHARVRTVHEAVVDRLDGHSVDVTTTHSVARGKRLVLQFTTGSGEVISRFAHVVSCTPIACDNGMQWRLTLSLAPVGLEPEPAS
jgi:hypothetical protein